jgi:fructose-specific phosphotransferase system IIC component
VVLLAFFCGAWLVNDYRSSGQTGEMVAGIASFLAGAVMIWYGRIVLRKLKHISYL